jgi:hypothetical protein
VGAGLHLDTVTIPHGNTMTVDPIIADDAAPGTASKVGLDCTVPIGPNFLRPTSTAAPCSSSAIRRPTSSS